MEEIEEKLFSNCPTTVAQVLSRIAQNLLNLSKDEVKSSFELKFLKDKCLSSDLLVSGVAGRCIIYLVSNGVLSVETTITDLLLGSPTTRSHANIVTTIGGLLSLEANKRRTYNLHLPQHPFITILMENSDAWNAVVDNIKYCYECENRELVNKTYRPVFLFCICNPDRNNTLNLYSHKLWTFLFTNAAEDNNESLLYNILCWMQIQTRYNLIFTSELLNESLAYNELVNPELFVLWQVSLLHYMTFHRFDTHQMIVAVKNVVCKAENFKTSNCQLLMLSKTVDICSPVCLADLLDLCLVLKQRVSNTYVLQTLNASLLHWLANPCVLIQDALKLAERILKVTGSENQSFPEDDLLFVNSNQVVLNANNDVHVSLRMCCIAQQLKDLKLMEHFLEKLTETPFGLCRHTFNFLCGLFLVEDLNTDIELKVFALLQGYTQKDYTLAAKLLTLILCKLPQVKEPRLHFELMKSLPSMVVLRENIPKVMAALRALSKGSVDLFNFCLSLMYQAWKIDHKCYPYLESMLMHDCFPQKKEEFYITKTYVLKELCEKKPELYGKDIVAHLSKILNECSTVDFGALPSAIALEGIKILCRAEVIDIITTWATLAPKFKDDRRIPVIKALCSLIEEIVHLSYTEQYTELYKDVVKQLWKYAESDEPQICQAAFNSLSGFSLEYISAYIPERYLENEDERKGSNAIPHLVPGETWIRFLMERNVSNESVQFIIKLVSAEIDAYLKYVYQVKGPREPTSYGYLPTHSIVRALGVFVKTFFNKYNPGIHNNLYIEVMKILSQEYSKPLPPLDWCFLQEVMHGPIQEIIKDENLKHYCVDIASHQVMLSGTARRLIENHIEAVTQNPKKEDIMRILVNLKYLANSIQPVIMKPFFEISFTTAIATFEEDRYFLMKLVDLLRAALTNKTIQDSNKISIAQALFDQILIVDIHSELFELLTQIVILLPNKCLEEITVLDPGMCDEYLERIVKIRCALAIESKITPLNWLNDIIEIVAESEDVCNRISLIYPCFGEVFRKHTNNAAECALWLLELIARIQAKVAERCDKKQLARYFDLLIFAIVQLSGFHVFLMKEDRETMKKLFPQATASLLDNDEWSVCTNQILEWLYHMNTEDFVPEEYRDIFGATLQSLRHEDEFRKHQRWMKYMSCNYQFG